MLSDILDPAVKLNNKPSCRMVQNQDYYGVNISHLSWHCLEYLDRCFCFQESLSLILFMEVEKGQIYFKGQGH